MPSKSTSSPPSRADERVMVFIDGSNLYHVLTHNCGRHDVQFGKFAEKLANTRELRRVYYYNIRQQSERHPEVATEQEKFLNALYDTPYLEVRLGISKPRGEAMVEKGVDVMIAIDLLKNAYEDLYDTAILVSGDGDFYPAIQAVKDAGKHVEVAAFASNISPEASRAADLHLRLTKTFFTGLWMSRRQTAEARAVGSKPEVTDEASSPEGEDKKPRTSRRRTSTRKTAASRTATKKTTKAAAEKEAPAAEPKEEAPKTTRRRRTTRRTRPAKTAEAPAESEAREEPARDAPAIRRTPIRRRIGGSAPSGNGDTPAETPKPPALRNARNSRDEADEPEKASEGEGRGLLRRLRLGGQ